MGSICVVRGKTLVTLPAPNFCDNFNRADSASSMGSPWRPKKDSVWGISANKALRPSAGTVGANTTVVSGGQTTGFVEARIYENSSGIVFRHDGDDSYLLVSKEPASTNVLRVTDSGGFNLILSSALVLSPGDLLRVDYTPTTFTLSVNGVSGNAFANTDFAANTNVGLYAQSNTATFDDFCTSSSPLTAVCDNFTAPDATTLASRGYTVGQFAVGTPAPAAIVELNRAKISGFTAYALRSMDAGDVTVEAVYEGGTLAALFPKYIDPSNYVYWRKDGVVRERVAGVNTETNIGAWSAVGTVLRVEVSGDVFRYFINGELRAKKTRTGFSTSVLTGIGHASTNDTALWDNLCTTPSAPSTLCTFSDSFTQANGTTLASLGYTVGQFSTGTPAPTATVQNNKAQFTGLAPYALRSVPAGNVEVQAAHRVGTFGALFPKYIDQSNYVFWRQDGVVREVVGGVSTETNIGGWSTGASTLWVRVIGDAFRYYKDGLFVAERIRPGFSASTLTGIGHAGSNETAEWDDLCITY